MTVQTMQSLAALFASMAAFLGGMYLVVTRPLSKRIDDLKDGVLPRLDRMESRLDKIEEHLTSLEKKVEILEIKAWK
jgi:hypothetical protein